VVSNEIVFGHASTPFPIVAPQVALRTARTRSIAYVRGGVIHIVTPDHGSALSRGPRTGSDRYLSRNRSRAFPRIKVGGLKAHEPITEPQLFCGSHDPEESETGLHPEQFGRPTTYRDARL